MKSFIGNIGSVEKYANRIALPLILASASTLVSARRDLARINGQNGLATAEAVENYIGETVNAAGYDLLKSIKNEASYLNHPDIVATRKEEIRLARERAESTQEQGLTTEINTNGGHVCLRDTVENCAAILARHPFGYSDKWTDEENKEAEQVMAIRN